MRVGAHSESSADDAGRDTAAQLAEAAAPTTAAAAAAAAPADVSDDKKAAGAAEGTGVERPVHVNIAAGLRNLIGAQTLMRHALVAERSRGLGSRGLLLLLLLTAHPYCRELACCCCRRC